MSVGEKCKYIENYITDKNMTLLSWAFIAYIGTENLTIESQNEFSFFFVINRKK